jgi:carboxylesterase type B
MLAYGGAKGAPFHGAIIESTALEATSTSSLTLDTFNDVAQRAGCTNGTNPQSNATLQCLKRVPMETLLNIAIAREFSLSDLRCQTPAEPCTNLLKL